MSIHYESLDGAVRAAMVDELDRDIANNMLYISGRLTPEGARIWPDLLREALQHHDDAWIAHSLRARGLMRQEEQRRKPSGGFTTAQVPHTAPDTLAEGEFNRFYARGLCSNVVASGSAEVEVYRGKEVQNPRQASEALIGTRVGAQALLNDLRTAQGVEPALGLPPGPNSGLTVRRL